MFIFSTCAEPFVSGPIGAVGGTMGTEYTLQKERCGCMRAKITQTYIDLLLAAMF